MVTWSVPSENCAFASGTAARNTRRTRTFRQRERDELGEAAGACDLDQPLQERGADSQTLQCVLHDERDFGGSGVVDAIEAPDADDVVVAGCDERNAPDAVDVDEPPHLGRLQMRMRAEEAQPLGLRRQPLVEREQTVGIVRADRSDQHRGAVPQRRPRCGHGGVRFAYVECRQRRRPGAGTKVPNLGASWPCRFSGRARTMVFNEEAVQWQAPKR